MDKAVDTFLRIKAWSATVDWEANVFGPIMVGIIGAAAAGIIIGFTAVSMGP